MPAALAHCWTWHSQVCYLFLATGPSLRGLKATWLFGSAALGCFLGGAEHSKPVSGGILGWHFLPQALARRNLHVPLATYCSSRGARCPVPAPVGRKGPCSISSPILPAWAPLSEENDLSWPEEHSRDFLEQLAEPAWRRDLQRIQDQTL